MPRQKKDKTQEDIDKKNLLEYFNSVCCEYIKITKLKNEFSFSFEGIVIDNSHILNIVNDSPRVFNIKNNLKVSGKIYNFSVEYKFNYEIKNDNVYLNKQNHNFVYNNKHYTNKKFSEKEIENYLLEWEIINSDNE